MSPKDPAEDSSSPDCQVRLPASPRLLALAMGVPLSADAQTRAFHELLAVIRDTAMHAGNQREVAGAQSRAEGPATATRRMSVQEAEAEARRLAAEDPAFPGQPQVVWAARIGCSKGTVGKLRLWEESAGCRAERRRQANVQPRARRRDEPGSRAPDPISSAVSLSKKHEDVLTSKGHSGSPMTHGYGEGVIDELVAAEEEDQERQEDRKALAQVLAEHERDHEPSPLDDDSPGRRRGVWNRRQGRDWQ